MEFSNWWAERPGSRRVVGPMLLRSPGSSAPIRLGTGVAALDLVCGLRGVSKTEQFARIA